MRLTAEEFIRRFLLHVLPKRFVRIRHYGLLAGRNVSTKLARSRKLLGDGVEPSARCGGRDRKHCPVAQPPGTRQPLETTPTATDHGLHRAAALGVDSS